MNDDELRRRMLECFDQWEDLMQPTLIERIVGFIFDHIGLVVLGLHLGFIALIIWLG